MYLVSGERLKGWNVARHGDKPFKYPKAISVPCPGCRIVHGFAMPAASSAIPSILTSNGAFRSSCPSCGCDVRFYCFPGEGDGGAYSEVWMYPSPPVRAGVAVEDISELTPGLKRDYRGALRAYEAGLWRPAASNARTTFEGVVKTLLRDSEKVDNKGRLLNLAVLFERLAGNRDLAQPIKDVGQVIREGGNLASHFEEDVEITPELAAEVLDLLDSFMDYLFVIPRRVDRLKALIDKPVSPSE